MHPVWDTISVSHLEKLLPLSTEVVEIFVVSSVLIRSRKIGNCISACMLVSVGLMFTLRKV